MPGALLLFLSIKAVDGFKVQAVLWQPETTAPPQSPPAHRPPAGTAPLPSSSGPGAVSVRHARSHTAFEISRISAALGGVSLTSPIRAL